VGVTDKGSRCHFPKKASISLTLGATARDPPAGPHCGIGEELPREFGARRAERSMHAAASCPSSPSGGTSSRSDAYPRIP